MTKLAISLGDPAGIGPEIVVAALAANPSWSQAMVLFGDVGPVQQAADVLGCAMPTIEIRPSQNCVGERVRLGQPSEASGAAAVAYLEAATAAVLRGECSALVTAPLSKLWTQRAGFGFPGHTEFLVARCGASDGVMMFAGPRLKVALATVHCALAEVPQRLTVHRLTRVIELLDQAMQRDFAMPKARIAVVGLNPHAGEHGLLGLEEQTIIAPAMAAAKVSGTLLGPWVPDAAFRMALDGAADAVIAMYHDQGLIPVKLIDFDDAVNVTLGLSIVRTSPDHGTAFDIAGQGKARATSMIAAVQLAQRMVRARSVRI
ncbi:MAG: 4-hydroxythreonine-4-phosphate dehydrogenase PdxA [Kofleriaceae bacterium]|nr:4-hydroxythreonine-4-phosphate dehydrogenase PdxA [Kofleriaceae bacterium]